MQKVKNLFLNDKFILAVIIINTLTIFSEGFNNLSIRTEFFINLIDSITTLLFIVEAIIKIRHYKWKKYISSNWNKIDFILIAPSLPSFVLLWFHLLDADLHFLLVFRITRVFKLLRFFKFIPGIADLAKGIKRALKTSVVVLFGFAIYNLIVSVLSCYLFKDIAPQYFGDPITSFYSTFKVFTVEGWYEIPDKMVLTLDVTQSFFIKLYFLVVLITGGIFGLSIVNSIFVDAMVSDNNDELEAKVDMLEHKIDFLIQIIEKREGYVEGEEGIDNVDDI